jgi:large subunit ribosomal protein L22e
MVSQAANKASKGPKAKTVSKFIIDASKPAKDKIFDVDAFVLFLQERIKIEGRTGNLGDKITVEDKGDGRVEVVAHNLEFSGRYLKYLYVVSSTTTTRS